MTDADGRNNEYADMWYMERPVSDKHVPMPVEDRAAQFAPFAALTGYEAAVERTALRHQEDVAQEIEHVTVDA